MPSWTAESEVRLLLAVIKTTNPKIPRVTWEQIAATMGAEYTFESVRQKYQNLKRDSEALNRGPATSNGPKANNSAGAKSKTTAADKKRKAASSITDDEEDFATPAKVRKLKAEKAEGEDKSCIKVKSEAGAFGDDIIDEA